MNRHNAHNFDHEQIKEEIKRIHASANEAEDNSRHVGFFYGLNEMGNIPHPFTQHEYPGLKNHLDKGYDEGCKELERRREREGKNRVDEVNNRVGGIYYSEGFHDALEGKTQLCVDEIGGLFQSKYNEGYMYGVDERKKVKSL